MHAKYCKGPIIALSTFKQATYEQALPVLYYIHGGDSFHDSRGVLTPAAELLGCSTEFLYRLLTCAIEVSFLSVPVRLVVRQIILDSIEFHWIKLTEYSRTSYPQRQEDTLVEDQGR